MKKHSYLDSVGPDLVLSCIESQEWEWMGLDLVSERNTDICIDVGFLLSSRMIEPVSLSLKNYRSMDYEET